MILSCLLLLGKRSNVSISCLLDSEEKVEDNWVNKARGRVDSVKSYNKFAIQRLISQYSNMNKKISFNTIGKYLILLYILVLILTAGNRLAILNFMPNIITLIYLINNICLGFLTLIKLWSLFIKNSGTGFGFIIPRITPILFLILTSIGGIFTTYTASTLGLSDSKLASKYANAAYPLLLAIYLIYPLYFKLNAIKNKTTLSINQESNEQLHNAEVIKVNKVKLKFSKKYFITFITIITLIQIIVLLFSIFKILS